MNNNKWGIKWTPKLQKSNEPIYLKIVNAIEEDIGKGILKAGDKMPPVRPLSYFLGCNVGTVYKAYTESEKRGLVKGETGRGTFVLGNTNNRDVSWPNEDPHSRVIDFSDNFPSNINSITQIVAKEFQNISQYSYINDILQYQHNSANSGHIDIACKWLNSFGIKAAYSNTFLTSGALNGGFISLLALCKTGDLILTEELTSQAIIGMAFKLNLRLKGIPMDSEGIIPNELKKIVKSNKVKAIYLTPNIQNPTTSILSLYRREEVARIAAENGIYIIEDDVFGALIPENKRVPTISSLLPEMSFYTTSVSKILSPALRIGYLKSPDTYSDKTLDALRITNWMASPTNAHITSSIIKCKKITDVLKLRRSDISKRQKIANDIFKGYNFLSNPYSMHLWLELPNPIRANRFVNTLKEREVAVVSSEDFAVDRENPIHAIRICLCTTTDLKEITKGLEKIRISLQH